MIALLAAVSLAQVPLQPWSTLVGHCFAGPAPGGGAIDKHCFESAFGGQHVRDRHVVSKNGRAVYQGESLYSAKGKQVIFTYWNSLGGLGSGQAVVAGDQWTFSGTIHATAVSAEEPMSTTWTIVRHGYRVSDGNGPPRLFRRVD